MGGAGRALAGFRQRRGGAGIETLTSWEPSLKLSGKVESGGVRAWVPGLKWTALWVSWRSKTPTWLSVSLQLFGTVTEKPWVGTSVLIVWFGTVAMETVTVVSEQTKQSKRTQNS